VEVIAENTGGAPHGQEASEFHQPFVILAFNPLTHEARCLATIEGAQLGWLEATVSMLKTSPITLKPITSGQHGPPSLRRGPKGRQVIVTNIDPDAYSGSIQKFQEFDTAFAASQALGSTYNSVNKALHHAGEDPITIDGVTFEYSDTYMARVNSDVRVD
jgi:hypothetical protein